VVGPTLVSSYLHSFTSPPPLSFPPHSLPYTHGSYLLLSIFHLILLHTALFTLPSHKSGGITALVSGQDWRRDSPPHPPKPIPANTFHTTSPLPAHHTRTAHARPHHHSTLPLLRAAAACCPTHCLPLPPPLCTPHFAAAPHGNSTASISSTHRSRRGCCLHYFGCRDIR